METKNFKLHGWIGIIIITLIISEIFMFLKVEPIATFFTPIAWSAYILIIDAVIYKLKGNSLIISRTKEFFIMLPLSILCWLVFEYYNLYLQNWNYIGLPENLTIRYFGYAWAFATIFPAIFETAELIEAAGLFKLNQSTLHKEISKTFLLISIAFGLVMLIIPLAFPSKYLFPPVWLGFIFLLEPINYLLDGKSILKQFSKGDRNTFYALLMSGFICGLLWEFWNFWAAAKWNYTVPYWGDVKIFEMPVVGYLGFPPFALECYAMYNFLMLVPKIFVKRQIIMLSNL